MKYYLFFALSFLFFASMLFLTIQQKDHVIKNPVLTTQYSPTPTEIINKPLTLDTIFQFIATPETSMVKTNNNEYNILATGDVIPARSVNYLMTKQNNFIFPFEKVAPVLKSHDLLFINLETPLIHNCPVTVEGMIFCGSQKVVQGLRAIQTNIVSLANNHSGNHGLEGLVSTEKLLGDNGIAVTGTGEAVIKTVRGKRFGFLGFNDIGAPENGIAWADEVKIKNQISKLKNQTDFVIVTFHWGTEYKHDPDQKQIDLAHLAIDSGADLIIGNHPHWVQGVEQYKNKFITYAHGNLVFDQMWSEETREGVIGQYIFNDTGLKEVHFYPVIIDNYSTPRFTNEKEGVKILNDMKESSLKLSNYE